MNSFRTLCRDTIFVACSFILAAMTIAAAMAQEVREFEIHNGDFATRGVQLVPKATAVNNVEGWLELNGCCFGLWDGTGFFGDQDTISGPSYLYLGNQNPGDLVSDSARFPIGEYEPNTTYTLTWAVGTRTQDAGPVSEDNVIVGPAEDDQLRLYYLDEDELGGRSTYELVAAASLESLGYEFARRTPGWSDFSLEFTTGAESEPWLGKPIALGYSRTSFWGFGEPPGTDPFPKEEWRWQSNIDDARLLAKRVSGLPALRPGDANQDLLFNQLDIVQVLQRAKYLTTEPASWGEGDWNGAPGGSPGDPPPGDGVFDQLDIVAALQDGLYLTSAVAAIQPDGRQNDVETLIVYDANTGELAVDAPSGSELASLKVNSTHGIVTGHPAENLGSSFDINSDKIAFKITFGASFGSLSSGNVVQNGLRESFLQEDLSVVGSLHGGGAPGDADLIYIPEPSSVLLLALGILPSLLHRFPKTTRV